MAAEYGLTSSGPNIKRLDVILEDMHTDLTERWGVNTQQNPESLLNHLLTNIADQIAELWEFGEYVYYSQYPSSAEGTSLDNAAQFGGSTRETAAKSRYKIHCTGIDGTTLESGTIIASDTNPVTQLTISEDKTITRSSFNKAVLTIASLSTDEVYTAAINGTVYSYTPTELDSVDVLTGLAEAITGDDFTATVDEEAQTLLIEGTDTTANNVLILSENLTTSTVTTIITFSTVEYGDIYIPDGVITKIIKASAGLQSVVNMCGYIAGQETETDTEFRISYIDKIFNRSSMMLESIRSAILENVQGAESVAAYENYTDEYDDYGRPPHSIEIVVDGGDSSEIAYQILQKKAGGINTYGDVEVLVPGDYDEDITIRFNRPTNIYVWYKLTITLSNSETVPTNYVELLREAILENMDELDAGDDVIPQSFMTALYDACAGITYIDLALFVTDSSAESPGDYTLRSVEITARQRAVTTEDMIEVEIDG